MNHYRIKTAGSREGDQGVHNLRVKLGPPGETAVPNRVNKKL